MGASTRDRYPSPNVISDDDDYYYTKEYKIFFNLERQNYNK